MVMHWEQHDTLLDRKAPQTPNGPKRWKINKKMSGTCGLFLETGIVGVKSLKLDGRGILKFRGH